MTLLLAVKNPVMENEAPESTRSALLLEIMPAPSSFTEPPSITVAPE